MRARVEPVRARVGSAELGSNAVQYSCPAGLVRVLALPCVCLEHDASRMWFALPAEPDSQGAARSSAPACLHGSLFWLMVAMHAVICMTCLA